ncbi:uncharacterized protein LACBIDRAFT_330656 [Laccaria bicolor S238N-H82]|uniref:Predicted protein n=1 Tax=Laccaria bicolor (strain S238N-H82 / ATCC MYA-4686) TaxID=486041 RepID=B0DM17_LACBS|nr:uncharacterized protein LACBIDRAFT_330656 [Laccaria bicolor S238N-H82]EDR04488.1 predicted protein [Laccaria bicolor S238N-H82]|eukprot:XP_001885007.1 predicted protein [Laccaria bicolor S238N-H82]
MSCPLTFTFAISLDATSNTTTLLWSTILKEAQITGRSLFEEDQRTTVNAEVNAARKDTLVNHKQHVGLLRSRLKAEWEELGDRQKEWGEKAKMMKSAEQDGLLYRDANYKIGNAHFHVLIDVTDEGLAQIPFKAFNEEYAKVTESWLECSCATVSLNRSLSTQKDRVEFTLDSMGIPIFPPISENTTTPDELRRTLIDFVQAQWEHTHMQDFLSIKAVPDILWTDHNFTSYLALSITTIPNPSTATITCLYELLSMIKAHQTDNSGVTLFSIQKSLSTPTPQSPLPTPPSPPPHTSTSRPSSQTSANATMQLSQTATPPQPQLPTKTPPLLPLLPPALSPPHSTQCSANAGDIPQLPPPALSPPRSPHRLAESQPLPPPSSLQCSANAGDDSQLPPPANSLPHSPSALANVEYDPQPPPSPLTPAPSIRSTSLTPPHDQDLLKQHRIKVGRKRKIGNNPKGNPACSKKVKLTNADDIVPVAPSRRSTRCKGKQAGSALLSSSVKAPKPALTQTGKPAKGWMAEYEMSDVWDIEMFNQTP